MKRSVRRDAMLSNSGQRSGFLRKDGKIGIRNRLLIIYTVNCSSFVAEQISNAVNMSGKRADLIGYESCFDNQVAIDRMLALIAHPNTGAVLIVGHGCEFVQADRLAAYATRIEKPVHVIMDQQLGTVSAIKAGIILAYELCKALDNVQRAAVSSFTVGLMVGCGASGSASYNTANTVCRDLLLRGHFVLKDGLYSSAVPEADFADRAVSGYCKGSLAVLHKKMNDFRDYHQINIPLQHHEIGPVQGVLPLATSPRHPGLWYIDTIQDSYMRNGLAATDLTSRAMDFVCSGAHLIILAAGNSIAICGTVLAPVMKVSDASRLPDCDCSEGDDIREMILSVVQGKSTASEDLGLFEGVLHASYQEKRNARQCKMIEPN